MPSKQSKFSEIASTVRAALSSKNVPTELQDALLLALDQMVKHHLERQYRPSEFNAGDFTESAVRILEFLSAGSYTPLGKTLPKMPDFLKAMERSGIDDSLRLHIPRLLQGIYDVRNRRGVGHLAGSVSANAPDAELLLTTARWILAEFVRLFHTPGSHEAAQHAVDLLAIHDSAIIEDFDGVRRVITRKKLSISQSILVLLQTSTSGTLLIEDLLTSIKVKPSACRMAVMRLAARTAIHKFDDGRMTLTSIGRDEAREVLRVLEES